MKQTKTNNQRKQNNILKVKCKLSHETLTTSQAICLNIKNNNTAYISKKYLDIFEETTTDNLKIDLLTCVHLGAKLTTAKTTLQTNSQQENNYRIVFKNNITLDLLGSDSEVKKYFYQLKTHKNSIKTIQYKNSKNNFEDIEDKTTYPPYARKLDLFSKGLTYNPDSKKSVIKTW